MTLHAQIYYTKLQALFTEITYSYCDNNLFDVDCLNKYLFKANIYCKTS